GSTIGEMDDIDEFELDELPSDAAGLRIAAPAGWQYFEERASTCPVLSLHCSVADLPGTIPQSRLRHLRTARNRAARRGEMVIIDGDMDNAEALLNELIRLH